MNHIDTSEELIVGVVDDDAPQRELLRIWLAQHEVTVREYPSAEALRADPHPLALVCLDLGLADEDGLNVILWLRANRPRTPILVVTARQDATSAVAALRAGAVDYLVKPLSRGSFLERVEEQLASQRARRSGTQTTLRSVIGTSPAMRILDERVRRVLESDVSVALFGESGSGKELVAHAIHTEGKRSKGPFVAINCAAIPESLQESELFGHERGAFTGATNQHRGRFEQAHRGTLFLDEIGEMSLSTQARLLRTLQEKTIRRVGGTVDIPIDVRIICATHRDLLNEVRLGRFREDLYFRLVVYPIKLPPLRDRLEDIPALTYHFLNKLSGDVGRTITEVSPASLKLLTQHHWPGNVREFQNIIHRAMLQCDGNTILPEHLPSEWTIEPTPAAPAPLVATPGTSAPMTPLAPLAEVERQSILRALDATGGHVGRAAQLLGMGRATLYRKLAEISPGGRKS